MAGDIDMGHARPAALDGAAQIGLANLIAARGLSVREAERLSSTELSPKAKLPAPAPDQDILRLEGESPTASAPP